MEDGGKEEPVRYISLQAATQYCQSRSNFYFVMSDEQWKELLSTQGEATGQPTWSNSESRARIGDDIVLIPAEVVVPSGAADGAGVAYVMKLKSDFTFETEIVGSGVGKDMGFRCISIVKP